jgi:hypothetical protein
LSTALTSTYRTLYGISTATTGRDPGAFEWGYDRGRSSLAFAGPHGKTYFFLIEKLDKVYPWGKIPHYSHEDAIEYANKWSDWKVTPDIRFAQIFQESTSFGLVALEEGNFKLWTWGRIACLGDSIHKMTINIGTGGNTAIESVAAFASELKTMLDECKEDLPSENQVQSCFKAYQKRREERAVFISEIANGSTRLQAMEGLHHRFVIAYLLPYLGDFVANAISDSIVNAELLVRGPYIFLLWRYRI